MHPLQFLLDRHLPCAGLFPHDFEQIRRLCVAPQFSLDNMWIITSSGVLGFSFIFGNSIRTVFESCMTLFVVHPFDVGDTVYIGGTYCTIEEASLNKVKLFFVAVFIFLTSVIETLNGRQIPHYRGGLIQQSDTRRALGGVPHVGCLSR